MSEDLYADETFSAPQQRRRLLDQDCPGLTILWHPDRTLIGAQAPILFKADEGFALSRTAPLFRQCKPGSFEPRPLADRSVSRQAILLKPESGPSIRIQVPDTRMLVRVDGQMIGDSLLLSEARMASGVILELGEQVVLCLGRIPALSDKCADLGLIGVGPAMNRIRAQIRQVADSDLPVLILGESGSGKELIADAVHRLSRRHAHALVRVNMATLHGELAAAELFGAVKGAFTGATQSRRGLFAEANGGTLFMDEIGDTPLPVQPMLLRALETGEYRMLGSARVERSSARIIAATDRQLQDGNFNVPLLRRLEAFVIKVPALRDRREDIGVLVWHFLQAAATAEASVLDAPDLSALARFDWPGNVRQLLHVVRRLVLERRHRHAVSAASVLEQLAPMRPEPNHDQGIAATALPRAAAAPGRRQYRDANTVTDAELCAALATADWCVRDAAEQLGVSRTSFYALLARSELIRQPKDLPQAELEAVLAAHPNTPALWPGLLRTPREALHRFLREHPLRVRSSLSRPSE